MLSCLIYKLLKIVVMILCVLSLGGSASIIQYIISNNFYSWQPLYSVMHSSLVFFWSRAYSKWHSEVAVSSKWHPKRSEEWALLFKFNLMKPILCIKYWKNLAFASFGSTSSKVGIWYLGCSMALFKSLGSTHILIFPGFMTVTMPLIQGVGSLTCLITPFCSSSCILSFS